jgi:hypothetical protein
MVPQIRSKVRETIWSRRIRGVGSRFSWFIHLGGRAWPDYIARAASNEESVLELLIDFVSLNATFYRKTAALHVPMVPRANVA